MARGYRYHGVVDRDAAVKVVCEGRLRRLYVRGVRDGRLDWIGLGRWCDGCRAIVDADGRVVGQLDVDADDRGAPLDLHVRGDLVEEVNA